MDHQSKIFQKTSLKYSIEIFLSIINIRNIFRKILLILKPTTANSMQLLMLGASLNYSKKIYINRKTWFIVLKLYKIIKIQVKLICMNKMINLYRKENAQLHRLILA